MSSRRLTTHPPRTRSERKDATRAHLLQVGRELFTRHGFHGTSVGMICRRARVTHGALYHHFASKTALFIAVLEEVTAEVALAVRRSVERTTGWNQVVAACDAYLEACLSPAVQTILLRDAPAALPRSTADQVDRAVNEPLVTGLLEHWMDSGLLRRLPVAPLAEVLAGAFERAAAVLAAAGPGEAPRARAQLRQIFSYLLGGLRQK